MILKTTIAMVEVTSTMITMAMITITIEPELSFLVLLSFDDVWLLVGGFSDGNATTCELKLLIGAPTSNSLF